MTPKENLTYQTIVNEFRKACKEHFHINSFDYGTIDYLDSSGVNRLYPFVFLRPMSVTLQDRVRTHTFELYTLDQPKVGTGDYISVVSDTEMLIYDLLSWFNFGPTDRQQVYDINLVSSSPVNEAFQDRLYGWVSTIEVSTPFNLSYCTFPQEVTYPAPSPTTPSGSVDNFIFLNPVEGSGYPANNLTTICTEQCTQPVNSDKQGVLAINIGTIIYSGTTQTSVWNGGNLWYGASDNVSGFPSRILKIDINGIVIDVDTCL